MMPALRPPSTRDEIAAELERVHAATRSFWDAFHSDEFFAPIDDAWSPADNVRHLVRSVRPLAKAMRLPRLVPRLLFGKATAPSRDFATLVADYQALLAAGGKAGRFAPPALEPTVERATYRRELMHRYDQAIESLSGTLGGWSEPTLDSARLPHPLLGKLTAREMLFFTVYHLAHHARNVARRRALPPPI